MPESPAPSPEQRRRRVITLVVSAVVVVAVVIAGILVLGGSDDGDDVASPDPVASDPTTQDGDPTEQPTGQPTEEPADPDPTTPPPADPVATTVYWANATEPVRLVRERVEVTPAGGDELASLARAAVELLITGEPADPDHVSLWPAETTLNDLTVDGDTVTVDLAEGSVPEESTELALQQLLYTAAGAAESLDPEGDAAAMSLQVLVDGSPAGEVGGLDLSVPVAQLDPLQALALVQLDSPTHDATLETPVQVLGEAAAYEATVHYTVTADGELVDEGTTTTAECCSFQPFRIELELDPGTYVVEVFETDASDGEGFAPAFEDRTFTVQ